MAANQSSFMDRKRLLVLITTLLKRSSSDHQKVLGGVVETDTKSVFSNVSSGNGASPTISDEVMKWIAFAETFPEDSHTCFGILSKLNEELASQSVILGDGLKPSEADLIVFSTIHSFVIGLSPSDRQNVPHVMRWMDYIQNKEQLDGLFENILLDKSEFEPQSQVLKSVATVEVDLNAKKISQSTKVVAPANVDQSKKTDAVKKTSKVKEATQEKKLPETEAVEKDKEHSVSLLNIQIGLIRKAWKHPSADSLLVEEIDVGEAKPRQVVSGLAKFYSPEELTNRHVVLITNVKPGKLRDVMSEGLVLCASNSDHSVVEPLLPPEGAKLGERILFSGIDGKPEDVLNPKKKQLEKITPHLFTDDKGIATFKGIPFMTSAGPCSSSIPKATIK